MSYTKLQYHIVFSTKERRAFLTDALRPRLIHYLGGIIRNLDGTLLEGNGPDDHLHLAAILHPAKAVSDLMRDVKARSSAWIHETFADLRGFAWQDGYAAFSVSHSAMPDVIAYIRAQQEHHRRMDFREELIALLRKHEIEFEEKYLL
jgi:REP element-mobilizing transposase RayT